MNRFLAGFLLVMIIAFSGCTSSPEGALHDTNAGGTNVNSGQMALDVCPNINNSDLNSYCLALAEKNESYCAKVQDDSKRDLCYGSLMKSLEKAELCDKMENVQNKDICYAQIGSIKGSIEFCRKVSDNDANYRDMCYASVANFTKQEDICLKSFSNNSVDICYLFLAVSWNNPSLCDKISSDARKYECFVKTDSCRKLSNSSQMETCKSYVELGKLSLEKCENASLAGGSFTRDSCYWNEATQKKDSGLCAEISSLEERMLCQAVIKNDNSLCCGSKGLCSDYCYREFADYKNDSSLCSYINSSADKVWCLAVTNEDSGKCDIYQNIGLVDKGVPWNSTLSLDEFCMGSDTSRYSTLCNCRLNGKNTPECYSKVWWLTNDCYLNVAVSKKDPQICDNMAEWTNPSKNGTGAYNSTNAFDCRSAVIASVDDVSVCSRPEFSGLKDSCTYWVALSRNQSALCPGLSSEKDRDNCFAIISSKISDASLCNRINNGESKDNCFANIAIQLKNPDHCQKIELTNSRDLCYIFIVENLV